MSGGVRYDMSCELGGTDAHLRKEGVPVPSSATALSNNSSSPQKSNQVLVSILHSKIPPIGRAHAELCCLRVGDAL